MARPTSRTGGRCRSTRRPGTAAALRRPQRRRHCLSICGACSSCVFAAVGMLPFLADGAAGARGRRSGSVSPDGAACGLDPVPRCRGRVPATIGVAVGAATLLVVVGRVRQRPTHPVRPLSTGAQRASSAGVMIAATSAGCVIGLKWSRSSRGRSVRWAAARDRPGDHRRLHRLQHPPDDEHLRADLRQVALDALVLEAAGGANAPASVSGLHLRCTEPSSSSTKPKRT